MEANVRKEVIPELDQLTAKASELKKELDYLLGRHNLYRDEGLASAFSAAGKLVNALRSASDTLKREGAKSIQDYITDWYHLRTDDEVGIPDPVYESVTYTGDDTWEIVMNTTTHGKERVIVHSNTATWDQVYSADSI